MRHRNIYSLALSLCLMLAWQAAPAVGQPVVIGSDGTDGELNVTTADRVIDLAWAATGPWNTTPHTAGFGVYDPVQWAVVFHYTDITINAGFKVTFKNHPKGAPVIWLATGDVTIDGSVELNGAGGSNAAGFPYAIPGPGGFSGGLGRQGGSAGFGPGGGGFGDNGGGGSYGTPGGSSGGQTGATYGTISILPLIGGSGGGADSSGLAAGGAGGGAILIASDGQIFLTGGISANGGVGVGLCCGSNGGGAGSGGGIRLISNVKISGTGLLQALGGTGAQAVGGHGRIRVEAPMISLSQSTPSYNPELINLGPVFPVASAPVLRVSAVNGITILPPPDADPQANVTTPDLVIGTELPVNIDVELTNMSTAAGMVVDVRVVQGNGGFSQTVQTMPLVDDGTGRLTATAVFSFTSSGNWEVQLSLPLP